MSVIPNLTYEYILGAVPIWGKPNTYYGSAKLKEDGGIFDDQLRYRVTLIADEDNGHKIGIRYYIGWKAYDLTPEEDMEEVVFPGSEEGAVEAMEWLREKHAELCKKYA